MPPVAFPLLLLLPEPPLPAGPLVAGPSPLSSLDAVLPVAPVSSLLIPLEAVAPVVGSEELVPPELGSPTEGEVDAPVCVVSVVGEVVEDSDAVVSAAADEAVVDAEVVPGCRG